jgi:cellulose synthase/poly-beta-1,6-N-acetylglucosamine synthase-like glycosyltransferase
MVPSSARTKSVAQRPTVSVIVPTSNEEDRIDQCLLAIGAKTYPRIVDVVVADGRSTGRIRERASAHPRVKRLDNAKRLQVAGLNLALTEVSGEMIVRVDRRQFLRCGRARAATARRYAASLSARQLAAPALVAGLLSPWRRPFAAGYALLISARATAEVRRDPPAAAVLLAVLPTMYLSWGLGFLMGIPKAPRLAEAMDHATVGHMR